eukprot:TRINITY_DN16603_c0_g1_i1.p2 TRINITY_DN16603_c0_g1~~TRINITY_DN16603_c0_g1_i1.p2  ORF type:complete len:333 (+),score=138.29 TRINITY_DN16603_c0_g1_i1:97-1095(+)
MEADLPSPKRARKAKRARLQAGERTFKVSTAEPFPLEGAFGSCALWDTKYGYFLLPDAADGTVTLDAHRYSVHAPQTWAAAPTASLALGQLRDLARSLGAVQEHQQKLQADKDKAAEKKRLARQKKKELKRLRREAKREKRREEKKQRRAEAKSAKDEARDAATKAKEKQAAEKEKAKQEKNRDKEEKRKAKEARKAEKQKPEQAAAPPGTQVAGAAHAPAAASTGAAAGARKRSRSSPAAPAAAPPAAAAAAPGEAAEPGKRNRQQRKEGALDRKGLAAYTNMHREQHAQQLKQQGKPSDAKAVKAECARRWEQLPAAEREHYNKLSVPPK